MLLIMIGHRLPPRSTILLGAAVAIALSACSSTSGNDAAGGGSASAMATASSAGHVDRAGPVDIGAGREIYLECQGTGSPTVILVSGFGNNAEVWNTGPTTGSSSTAVSTASVATSSAQSAAPTVYRGVGEFTRVCAYDRPGTIDSRSTEVPQPTSAQSSADDLAKLLGQAGEAQPYILVGHSYGGPIVRIFAGDHPDQVGGVVLVDGFSEDLENGLTADQRAVFHSLNTPPASQPGAENVDFTVIATQVRQAPAMPDVPVTVLTADTPQLTPELLASSQVPPGVDQAFADALWTAQLAAQQSMAAKFPGAVRITDTHSDHYIQLGNPQLVIDSIRDVVDKVRESK
jgi:pimeloyl-ACP methyl ester carboxylesterase